MLKLFGTSDHLPMMFLAWYTLALLLANNAYTNYIIINLRCITVYICCEHL